MIGQSRVAAKAEMRTGLRSVELRREPDQWGKSFTFVVNGIPMFAKGANVIPFDSFPSRVTPERYRQILTGGPRRQHEHGARMGRRHLRERRLLRHLRRAWPDGLAGVHVRRRHGARRSRVSAERSRGGDAAGEAAARSSQHRAVVRQQRRSKRDGVAWADRLSFKESITPPQRERVWQDYVVLFHDILKSVAEEYATPIPYWPSSPSAELRGSAKQRGQRRHALLGRVARPGAHRELQPAEPALHVGVRLPVVPRDAHHPELRRARTISPSIRPS